MCVTGCSTDSWEQDTGVKQVLGPAGGNQNHQADPRGDVSVDKNKRSHHMIKKKTVLKFI